MAGKRILSDAQIEEMIVLRERGWGTQRIAQHFTDAGTPISIGSISWQCLRVGADAPLKLRGTLPTDLKPYVRNGVTVQPFSPEEDALLRVLDLQGFSIAVICRRMGRKSNSVRGRLYTLTRHDTRIEESEAA